jgi:transposase
MAFLLYGLPAGKEDRRAGRFAGWSELEWRVLVDIMPPEPTQRRRGMPQTPCRQVIKTLLSRWLTGCRWCETPRGPLWASTSAAQRGLQRWPADGTWATMQARVLGLAEERGMMHGESGAGAGACSPWDGRG